MYIQGVKRKLVFCYLVMTMLLLFSVGITFAADTTLEYGLDENCEEIEEGVPVEVVAFGGFISEADFNNSGASFSQQNYEIGVTGGLFRMEYQHSRFNWNDTEKLKFGRDKSKDPWKDLNNLAFGVSLPIELSDDWFVMVALDAYTGYEDRITSDSFGYSGMTMVGYTVNEYFKIYVGAGVNKDPIRWGFAPVAGLEYEDDDWLIAIGFPSTVVQYRVTPEWILRTEYSSTGGIYKLSKNSAAERNGFASIQGSVVGIYADWIPLDGLLISLGPEYHFDRSIRLYDKNGHRVGSKSKPDNAFGAALNISYDF